MTLLTSGNELGFFLLIAMCVTILVIVDSTKKGNIKPKIRILPALEAIKEGIGRAAEMGGKVHFTSGSYSLLGSGIAGFPSAMAAVSIVNHVAKLCAEIDVPLIDTVANSVKYVVEYESIKEGYIEAGYKENFISDNVRFTGGKQNPYVQACLNTFQKENIVTNIMAGSFAGEAASLAEGGSHCFQIGGNAKISQIHFFVVICDYVLMGEEVFAAGAALKPEPETLATIFTQDLFRYLALGLIGIGVLLSVFNIDSLYQLL